MNLPSLKPLYKPVVDAISRALTFTDYVVSGCVPTIPGVGLRVDVASGVIMSNSVYLTYAGGNITLTAAHASLPRRDIVYLNTAAVLSKVDGTAASPDAVPPTLPANGVLICVMEVAPAQAVFSATDMIDGHQQVGSANAIYNQSLNLAVTNNTNARIAGIYVKTTQASGGGVGVLPLVGLWAASDAASTSSFASPSHAVAVLGYNTLGTTSAQGAGYYGVEGRVDHVRDVSSSPIPSSWGVLGLVSMQANAPANLMASIGTEGRVEIGSGVTGAANHILIGGKFTVTASGTGGTVGSPSAINLLVGDGTVSGQNFPLSLRGYSSLTASPGEGKADFTIRDGGAVFGGYLLVDITSATMQTGMVVKLSEHGGLGAFQVQDDAGDHVLQASSNGVVAIGNATAGKTAAIDLIAANSVPVAPAAGTSRYYRDPNDGLLKGQDSNGFTSVMENLAPSRLMWEMEDFNFGLLGTNSIGKLGWTYLAGLVAGVTAIAGVQNHPGIAQISTLATSDGGAFTALFARATAATGVQILDIANTTTEVVWIFQMNQANTDANLIARFGMGAVAAAWSVAPTDGIYIEKLAADAGFFGVTRAAGVQTRTATALLRTGSVTTWGAATWLRAKIRRSNATTIAFSLDGQTEQTSTTNIPAVAIEPFAQLGNNSTAAAKTADLDYFHIIQSGFSR